MSYKRKRVLVPGIELKFHDVDVDDSTISSSGTIMNSGTINIIAGGVTESQRVGRNCVIHSIGWRINLELPAAASTQSSDQVRLIMYLDKQCNGATAAVTDILESASFLSFNNLSNRGRFRILMDKHYLLNTSISGNGSSVNTIEIQEYDDFYKSCTIPLEFSGATGAITELRSNNLGILTISKNGLPSLTSKIRLRYSDG